LYLLAASRKKVVPTIPTKHILLGIEPRNVGIYDKDSRKSFKIKSIRMATIGADG
jgi:hypothetical protein